MAKSRKNATALKRDSAGQIAWKRDNGGMMIHDGLERLRAYLQQPGVRRNAVAKEAGINWHAVDCAMGGDPRLSTLLAIEKTIPSDFEPSPASGLAPGCGGAA